MARKTQKDKQPKRTPFRLLDLPVELVDHIYALSSDTLTRSPLCKALLPLYRKHAASRVVISSVYRLRQVKALLRSSKGSSSAVQTLEIRTSSLPWSMSKIEDEMRGLPSLLGSSVTSLVLDGCSETLYAALDSGLFSALARLESLSLRWSRRPYQRGQPPPLPVVSLPRLKHLCLLSSEVSETIKGIFASAKELESLELYGVHSWTHSPQCHLELLQHIKQLKKLLLSGTGSLRPTASAIASLPSLERLTLEGAFDLGDISAAQEIGKAPTSHIVLTGEHYISPYSHSVPFLLSLVEQGGAPDSRRSLRRLTLNAFTACKGPSAKDVDFDPWEFDARHKPIFTGVMRRTYIEQFISDFEAKGLVVDGTALKAVKYDRFHDDERAKLKAFLRETGDERGEGWLSDTDSEYEP